MKVSSFSGYWIVLFLSISRVKSQSLRDVLMPEKDSLPNRVISFLANQIFESDVVPQLNDVHFYLWTRYNPLMGIQLLMNRPDLLLQGLYDRRKPVKVLIHGFTGNGTTDGFVTKAAQAFLKVGDVNVISVDWSGLAKYPNYARAALSTEPVGVWVSQFLDFLILHGTPASSIHIIGYSLGAHVAGSAGFHLQLGRLARITGLEPASGGFERPGKLRSLRSSDAEFVDIIHTNANVLGLGTVDPIGHADFYPNGGHWQYGCAWNKELESWIQCSHGRATKYFIESILAGPGKFLSSPCSSYVKFTIGLCDDCSSNINRKRCASMGEYSIFPRASGVYFLKTNPDSPYSLE